MPNKKYLKTAYVFRGFDKVTPDDLRMLTHINIAFGHCVDSKISISHFKQPNIDAILEYKKINPELKLLLSVGGWGAGGFSPMSATSENRKKFAESSIAVIERLGLDGIDIDWEYPCIGSAGIEYSPDDKQNFTYMLDELRNTLDKNYKSQLLTIAVGAGKYFTDSTEMDKVAPLLDYVQLMTYDTYNRKNCSHHTNLYPMCDRTVDLFNNAGVPIEKLVLGAAFYSRLWKCNPPVDGDGLNAQAETGGMFGPSFGDLHANYIIKIENGYTAYWDDEAKAPYLFNGTDFISYDDERSIAAKCGYIKEKSLAGIMYWEHSCDPTRLLLNAINDNL